MPRRKPAPATPPTPPDEPKPDGRLTRLVDMASQLGLKAVDRRRAVQNIETGMIVGVIGMNGTLPGFCPDGTRYTIGAKALRELANHLDLFALEIAS